MKEAGWVQGGSGCPVVLLPDLPLAEAQEVGLKAWLEIL